MNITIVSPELMPLVKVGGLADVVSALSAALHRRGENPSLILPFYRCIPTDRYAVVDTGVRCSVWMDGRTRTSSVWEHRHGDVPVYLIANDELYDRDGVYGAEGLDYPDNPFRFAHFARAALEAAIQLDLRPEVFHVHDWQTALLPVYLGLFYRDHPELGGTGVALSIHNLAYQGLFDADYLPRLGLPPEIFHPEGIEFYGKVNFLKGGIVFSDVLATVSPTYAREIQTEEMGAGLDGVLRKRKEDLIGILNGIDTSIWNPRTDPNLFLPYDASHTAGKAENKRRLQQLLGLEVSSQTPLAGCVARLDPQKGFDLLLEIAPEVLSRGIQLVLLGSGRKEILEAFRNLAAKHPKQISLNEGFQAELAPRIYGGADLFLMPSRYEPCGLGQMIALRYGTLPVVRRTGGLADTIIDVDEDPEKGNGFVFDRFGSEAFLDAVERAVSRLGEPKEWGTLVARAMHADFSWKGSTDRYMEVYERAIDRRRSGK